MQVEQLQQLLTSDYFAIFGLKPEFNIDKIQLAAKYRNLQKQFHPDNFSAATDNIQLLSLQASSKINVAYNILNSPLERALLLLKLQNLELDLSQNTSLGQDFLLQQMDIHEEIEAAKADADIQYLTQITEKLQLHESSIIQTMTKAFNTKNWRSFSEATKQLSFYVKLIMQVKQTISHLW